MTEYNIRLNPNCAAAVHTGLKFKAGDKGITFRIAVDELDTTGTTAKIVFLRANGTSVESDISGTDGVYIYKTLGNEFAVPGKTVADVKFYASGNRESTASFIFEVCGDTMNGLGAGTGGYSDRLEQLVSEAEAAVELTEQAKAELEAAESNMKTTEAEMAAVIQNFKNQYGEVGALNPRGDWNNKNTYQIRDIVYHNSCSWISLVDGNNMEPSDANKEYWMRSTDLEAIINGTTPVGNALKLNGLGADSFVQGVSPYFTEGETILDWANNPNGVYKKFIISPYFPSDAPKTAEGWCELLIDKEKNRKSVKYTQFGSDSSLLIYERSIWNKAWRGNGWTKANDGGNADTLDGAHLSDIQGWVGSKFVPLDGSKPMKGNLEVDKGTSYSHILVKRTQSDGSTYGAYEYIGTDKSVTFALKDVGSNTTKANFTLKEGGATIDNNTVLHTGNSQKVVTSASAPSDTSALWVDTANKKVKTYIDGAWTALE